MFEYAFYAAIFPRAAMLACAAEVLMRIVSVGGGPAGLYLAILMKKADPSHEVTVIERNRADDTFGFGVVFSDATLGTFAAADRESHDAIRARFAHWDDIDIHYRGEARGRREEKAGRRRSRAAIRAMDTRGHAPSVTQAHSCARRGTVRARPAVHDIGNS